MNLPDRPLALAKGQSELRTDTVRVARQPIQTHAEARFGSNIVKELRLRSILGHNQVHPAVLIVVAQGGATLLTIHPDTTLLSGHRGEVPLAIAPQPKSPARI